MTDPATEPRRADDGRFAVLASERPFTGRIASVRVDTVAMPGGGSARREVVEHMRAVAVVALDEAGRVTMIEQYRHPLRRRVWEIPAGLMDIDGEPPVAAAARELVEEVGLTADRWSVLADVASSPGFCTESVRVYLATGLAEVPPPEKLDEEADLRIVRVPLGEAVDAVLRGDIVNATAICGLLAAARVVDGGEDARAALRDGADPWTDSPALVHEGAGIGASPRLAAAVGADADGVVAAADGVIAGAGLVPDGR